MIVALGALDREAQQRCGDDLERVGNDLVLGEGRIRRAVARDPVPSKGSRWR